MHPPISLSAATMAMNVLAMTSAIPTPSRSKLMDVD